MDPNVTEIHPFGCPVYVTRFRDKGRWKSRARLGVYLGPSPHHAASVGLILNTKTSYVSPQFHCTYDDYFETPKLEGNDGSHWKTLTKVQDDEYDLFNPEFDSTNGEPYKKYNPSERLFDNPDGSLESEGEIDIPQMTSADSDSDSDSDSSDDDDETGYRTRSSTRKTRQIPQTPQPQPKRGSDAKKRGSSEEVKVSEDESDDDDNAPDTVPPPPSRSERHVTIEGDKEFQEWPELSSPEYKEKDNHWVVILCEGVSYP